MSGGSRSPEQVLAEPGFRELQAFVIGRTGLAYYEKEAGTLALHLAQRMAAVRVMGCAAYLELLRGSMAEMDALVAVLTVGETFFFRHAEAFAALRAVVLPELLERNHERRTLRIWSAGCANGAEPYSLAILLRQEFGARLQGWDVSIVGTDINRQALARAQEGRFAAWALRAVTDDVVAACFIRVGGTWEIRPEYRQWISFRYGNLASDPRPDTNDPTGQDLVLCRNVMIYFDRPTIRRTLQRLHEAMANSGWLLIGPSEHNGEDFRGFQDVACPGVTLYQRGDGIAASTTSRPEMPRRWLLQPPWSPPVVPEVGLPAARSGTPAAAPPPVTDADQLRALADRGAYACALEESNRLLRQMPGDARVHFYRALVLGHLDRQEEREQALRNVIYLDRTHALAHYELALLLRDRGNLPAALRSLRNVLRLLQDRDGGERLHGEDVTILELARLATTQMQSMQTESTR